jgi:hypothetical protein
LHRGKASDQAVEIVAAVHAVENIKSVILWPTMRTEPSSQRSKRSGNAMMVNVTDRADVDVNLLHRTISRSPRSGDRSGDSPLVPIVNFSGQTPFCITWFGDEPGDPQRRPYVDPSLGDRRTSFSESSQDTRRNVTDSDIESFMLAFEDGLLSKSEWTHSKHLIIALWYLRRHDRDEATRLIRGGIQRHNERQGNLTGYHETITLSWVAVIERFLGTRDLEVPVSVLAGELLRQCGDKNYLLRFYSRDRLFSDEARARWVPPDLAPIGERDSSV